MIRDLSQVVFFAAWFVVLYRYQPLRNLVRATPRGLTIPLALVTAAWILAHIADQRVRFFPIVSVYMYGDYTPRTEMNSIAVTGERCDGNHERLDLAFMGRARLRSRMQSLYEGLSFLRTAADSAKRWDLIDRTLVSIGRIYNRSFPDRPLCSVGFDEIRVTHEQLRRGPIPPARMIHDVVLR